MSQQTIGATYARRSSEKNDNVSLKAQTEKNLEYATRVGMRIPDTYTFEEDDFTGRVASRPVLDRVFQLAREKKITAIVVYLVDRWARDIGAGAELINLVFELGIELHIVSWGTQVRNIPMDYARYNMEMLFSDVERRTIVKRLADAKGDHSRRGYLIGGGRYVKYGYKRVERLTEHGKVKDLDRNFDTFYPHMPKLSSPGCVVQWIFEQVAYERKGVTAICDYLNDTLHIPSPAGRRWDISRIYRIVHEEAYYGQFYYQMRRAGKVRAKEERISIVRPDLALVDKELWQQANNVIDSGKGFAPQYNYLFSRRVKCMHGHKMLCQPGSFRKNSPRRFYYICRTRKDLRKECNMPYFRLDIV